MEIRNSSSYLATSYYQEEPHKGQLNFQLVLTMENEDGVLGKISPHFGLKENEKRSAEQVVYGKIEIINLELN